MNVGDEIRVRTLGGVQRATLVRDTGGDWVRVRFPNGRELGVKRAKVVGSRKAPPTKPLERVPNTKRPEFVRVGPAMGPIRSAVYLAHVRERSCCICGKPGPSDPHHYGPRGMGQKTDDLRTVPLCRGCHDAFHATGACPPYDATETALEFYRAQVDALIAFGYGTSEEG